MHATQRALDRTLWPPLAGGCHLSRDRSRRCGRRASSCRCRRMTMPENGPALPQSFCVIGTAWRPVGDAGADGG
ncbi:SAM-dependent methyltransferase OS=Streptomyces albaduncus OX=68172 GN=FHS32_002186 PE=4 SV=1 [Streptomyces griseoloalbus]